MPRLPDFKQVGDNALTGVCEGCNDAPSSSLHECPKKMHQEFPDTTLCNCCGDCTAACASEVNL